MKARIVKTKDGCLLVEITAEPFTTEIEACHPYNTDRLHPFYRLVTRLRQMGQEFGFEEIRAGRWSEYVADNPVTRAVIELLNMDDNALGGLTGNTTADDYRAQLVAVLATLWD